MMSVVVQCLAALLVVSQASASLYSGRFGHCLSTDECGFDGCCVLGMNRYSIPACFPRGQLGEVCRPYSLAENMTLWYPNGFQIDLVDIYRIICPCAEGLYCNSDTITCEPTVEPVQEEEPDLNAL